MIGINPVDYKLQFRQLYERDNTDMIVVHHTGSPEDEDWSAEDVHICHLNQGWSGCGYHYIIRKNGCLEYGRPDEMIGAHSEGWNNHTLGIHVSGNFEIAYPSEAQLHSLIVLIAHLCEKYNIPVDDDHIVGHCDLMATSCPGKNLYDKLPEVIVGVRKLLNIEMGD